MYDKHYHKRLIKSVAQFPQYPIGAPVCLGGAMMRNYIPSYILPCKYNLAVLNNQPIISL